MADITEWKPEEDIDELASILHACVHARASISFVLPFSLEDARLFWDSKVTHAVSTGTRRVLVARSGQRLVGTVQLDLGTPPNQNHRAEVSKLLVHPDARRQGIARALMLAIEDVARRDGRSLLTLDTRTGDSAESLYVSLGYTLAGIIPRFARDPLSPDLHSTSILYKEL